ncbi:hypothetical protein BJ170DRAFT_483338 [Xylariales sp. AK1849]|nr:hypothetical protein BJ170DRAFT_483338 [Xylariales sp. AK1849]
MTYTVQGPRKGRTKRWPREIGTVFASFYTRRWTSWSGEQLQTSQTSLVSKARKPDSDYKLRRDSKVVIRKRKTKIGSGKSPKKAFSRIETEMSRPIMPILCRNSILIHQTRQDQDSTISGLQHDDRLRMDRIDVGNVKHSKENVRHRIKQNLGPIFTRQSPSYRKITSSERQNLGYLYYEIHLWLSLLLTRPMPHFQSLPFSFTPPAPATIPYHITTQQSKQAAQAPQAAQHDPPELR